MILRPMKAPNVSIADDELKQLHYPIVGSPKLDGFRGIGTEHGMLTSSMSLFTNRYVAEVTKDPAFHGLDGELIVGSPFKIDEDDDVFNRTSGPLRRFEGEPDFTFYVFDRWEIGDFSYKQRWLDLQADLSRGHRHQRIVVLKQQLLTCADDVIAYEKEMVEKGFEGAMIRSLDGLYKEGRCTLREMNIFKRKPFEECEATIIGVEEQLANLNEAKLNNFGLTKRSSCKANKVPKGTIGKLILQSPLWPKVESFKSGFGKGFDDKKKQEIWDNKEAYIGMKVTIKYQKYGSIDRPREPKVIKIRPAWDLQ